MFLNNVFVEASGAEGDEREQRLRYAVLALAPVHHPETWEEAAPTLLPAVRAVSWKNPVGASEVAARPFAPFLALLTARDSEYSMSYVTSPDLDDWGVDAETVEARASANFGEYGVPVDGEPPRLEIVGPDGYVSSWLTAGDVLARIGERIGGEFVVLAPSRDALRLVATADRDRLQRELELALAEYEEAPRQLSPVPYAVVGGRVVEWGPPDGDPCAPIVDRCRHMLALVEYTVQRNALVERLEATGEDVFVANYILSQLPDGSVQASTAWSRGIVSSLPRTDVVSFVEIETKAVFEVRWDDVIRVAGDALRSEPGSDPPRWRVADWPDAAVLEQLRALAVVDG